MNTGISVSELIKKYLEESGQNQPILPGMTRPPQPATAPAKPPAGGVQSKFNKGYSYQPEPLADEIEVPGREKRGMAKKPFHKDNDRMAMMFSALSDGFGGMTLSGKSGMAAINKANYASGMEGVKQNKSMDYLIKNNPALAKKLMKISPQYRDQFMEKALTADPEDSYRPATAEEYAAYGIPVDGNGNPTSGKPFRVNSTTGKLEAIGGGGTTINNAAAVGAPDKGYRNVYDEAGRLTHQEVIPGSPADQERIRLAEKGVNRGTQKGNAASTVVQDLERSIEKVTDGNASNIFGDAADGIPFLGDLVDVVEGATAVGLSKLPGGRTDASQALQLSESARSNIGIDSLQNMRENSPTGGALGQVPFQQQQRLEQLYGQLNPVEMQPEEYVYNANRVINLYSDLVYGNRAQRQQLVDQGIMSAKDFAEIESRYKPLTRDASGRPFDLTQPPPDFDAPAAAYQRATEDQKLRMWNLYEIDRFPKWYEQ